MVAGLLGVLFLGKKDVANSPVFNQAAAFLESRCATGCVVNFLPQPLRTQAWVDLEAQSPFPRLADREARVLDAKLPEVAKGYDFTARPSAARGATGASRRVERARQTGFVGPVLYVQSRVKSFSAFHPVFDQALKWEGSVDLQEAREERRFSQGEDEVVVFELPAR